MSSSIVDPAAKETELLPSGSYTGRLVIGDYSLEAFPQQQQLKQLANEYWRLRSDPAVQSAPVITQDPAGGDRNDRHFEQRKSDINRQLVTDIVHKPLSIRVILEQLNQHPFGEMPRLFYSPPKDILSLIDPAGRTKNSDSPLLPLTVMPRPLAKFEEETDEISPVTAHTTV